MIKPEIKSQIITFVEEEVDRIQYGKLIIEVTVMKGQATNVQGETRRSMNINNDQADRRVPASR